MAHVSLGMHLSREESVKKTCDFCIPSVVCSVNSGVSGVISNSAEGAEKGARRGENRSL